MNVSPLLYPVRVTGDFRTGNTVIAFGFPGEQSWKRAMWAPLKATSLHAEAAVPEACSLLGLPRTGDEAESVARKVQELAQIGERDPKRLCMGAVKCFQA